MGVAREHYRFSYRHTGSNDKDCDSIIFKNSSVWTAIQNNELGIPDEEYLIKIVGHKISYFHLENETFELLIECLKKLFFIIDFREVVDSANDLS